MKKQNFTPFIVIIVIIALVVGAVIIYNKMQAPFKEESDDKDVKIKALEENQTFLQQKINELESEATKEPVEEKKTISGWTLLLGIALIVCIIYIILSKTKPTGTLKKRHEIIDEMRKYADKHDGKQLFQCVAYGQGVYKENRFPIAVVLYVLNKTWFADKSNYFSEPPKEQIYGYLVRRDDLEDVFEDFKGMSIKEVKNCIKEVAWGMRWIHYADYKHKATDDAVEDYLRRKEGMYREKASEIDKIEAYRS